MANFSVNQAKHLYVAKAVDANLDTLGDIKFSASGDGDIFAKYVGRDGVVRTDLIKLSNIVYAKAVKASSMSQYLDSAFIASTSAVAGQQYILKVTMDEFGGMTQEDNGFIFADYTAKSGDAAKNVLAELAISLAKNAAVAAYNPMINVFVTTAATPATALTLGTNLWKVEKNASAATVAGYGSLTGIIVEAAEQPYTGGKYDFNLAHITVTADKIVVTGLETEWATITKNVAHPTPALNNSKKIADLERFCMGERGDVYRGAGWPNNFEFKPLVDETAANGYHLIDIAYYYAGDAEDVQKSPRELIVVAAAEGATTYTLINAVVGDINTAAGSDIVAELE